MSFDWLKLLDVADDLLRYKGEEYARSVINRAYYAVFGSIKDLIETRESHRFSTAGTHQQVIGYLVKNSQKEYRRLGYILSRLRRERVKADYGGKSVVTANRAYKAFKWANDIKKALAEMK